MIGGYEGDKCAHAWEAYYPWQTIPGTWTRDPLLLSGHPQLRMCSPPAQTGISLDKDSVAGTAHEYQFR